MCFGGSHWGTVTASWPKSRIWAINGFSPPTPTGPSMASHPPLPPDAPWNVHSVHCSHSGSHFQGCNLESVMCCWDYLDGLCDWTHKRSLYTLLRVQWQVWRSTPLAVAQDKFPMWFPCLPAAYQSGAICVFLWSLPVLCVSGPLCELIAYVRDGLSVWLWE